MSYKVKKGDTLSKIAKEHNMSLDELLKLNDISRDKANHILIGQNIKVKKNIPDQSSGTSTPFVPKGIYRFSPKTTDTTSTKQTAKDTEDKPQSFTSYWNPMQSFSNSKIKSTDSVGVPYKADYTISEYAKNNASTIQQQLIDIGYNIGSSRADGKWGENSQKALDQALVDGYTFKHGKLNAPQTKKQFSNTVHSTVVPVDHNVGLVKQDQLLKPIQEAKTTEELQQVYQHGPGIGQILGSYLYHIIAPTNWKMPHSKSLKDQVAAGIKYSESLPDQAKETDSTTRRKINTDGSRYIGYNTWGTLAGQSGNVNEQSNAGNGASKIMGGLRYKLNEDGSVDVNDTYSFNIIRDFSTLDKKGKPLARNKQDSNDPYIGRPWKGLVHDLKQPYSDITSWRGLQNLAENFGTRQGKIRENNIHYDPEEIGIKI